MKFIYEIFKVIFNLINPCEHIKKSSVKAPEPQLWLYFELCLQKA